jgi:hypothetical protein
MGVEILRTSFSRGVQPLRRREVNVWMHSGPSCPDCPFSMELGNTGIETQIRWVLAYWVDPNFGPGLVPPKGEGQQPMGESIRVGF